MYTLVPFLEDVEIFAQNPIEIPTLDDEVFFPTVANTATNKAYINAMAKYSKPYNFI